MSNGNIEAAGVPVIFKKPPSSVMLVVPSIEVVKSFRLASVEKSMSNIVPMLDGLTADSCMDMPKRNPFIEILLPPFIEMSKFCTFIYVN